MARSIARGGEWSWPIAGSRVLRNLVSSGRSWPGWIPARDQSAWVDGELELQGLRLALAVDVDIRHLPVRRLAVARLGLITASSSPVKTSRLSPDAGYQHRSGDSRRPAVARGPPDMPARNNDAMASEL